MFRYRLFWSIVICASFLYCLFDSGYLSFILLSVVLILSAVSLAFLLAAARKISVKVIAEHALVNRGEAIVFDIHLRSRSLFPVSMAELRLKFENLFNGELREETVFLPVGFRSEQTAQYRIQSRFCGKMMAELTYVKSYDMLGIFTKRKKAGQSAFVLILPQKQVFQLHAGSAANPRDDSTCFSNIKPGNDTAEVFDIRPFRETDTLRSIHWKLSMKRDELIAKEFSLPGDVSVLLLLELMDGGAEALDTAVESLISLSGMLLSKRILHRVEWYDTVSGQLQTASVQSDNDLAEATCAVLSAKRYKEKPCLLACLGGMSRPLKDSPYAVYITERLTEELEQFCCRAGAKETTVLYCGQMNEHERELKNEFPSQNVKMLEVMPGKTGESLSGLEI